MIRYCLTCLSGLLILLLMPPSGSVQAHGGTLINSGTSPSGRFGWMISVAPYPVITGPVSFSLLVFDTKTSAIVDTVSGELYLAAPNSARPCCEPGAHLGPYPLLLEPFQFGDYIAYVPVEEVGAWEVQFRLTVADDAFTVVAPFAVEADGGMDSAAIQAAVAELTKAAQNQMQTPAQATSPLTLPVAAQNAATQVPSPLALPAPTSPLLPAIESTPVTNDQPAAVDNRTWLIGGGALAIGVGIVLLWWQTRKKKV